MKREPSNEDVVVRKLTLKEEWLAKREDHPDFKPNTRVRVVVETLIHKTRFGKEGRIVVVSDGSALIELQEIRVSAPVIIPIKLLCSVEQFVKATPLKTMLRVSIEAKQMILMEIGVSDPLAEQVDS